MNGKTIEVINTDAEGPADPRRRALLRARSSVRRKLVDAATLTGACVIALGHAASRRDVQRRRVRRRFLAIATTSASATGSSRSTTSTRRSRATSPTSRTPAAGAPAPRRPAAFLRELRRRRRPWIHLDIAGTAYLDNESPFLAKGRPDAGARVSHAGRSTSRRTGAGARCRAGASKCSTTGRAQRPDLDPVLLGIRARCWPSVRGSRTTTIGWPGRSGSGLGAARAVHAAARRSAVRVAANRPLRGADRPLGDDDPPDRPSGAHGDGRPPRRPR